MNRYLVLLLFAMSLSQLVTGCSTKPCSEKSYAHLGPALTKLCFSIEQCMRADIPPPLDTPDDLLLTKCTWRDPSLLKPFEGLKVKVLRINSSAALLVCNKDESRGILEDACCSGALEKNEEMDKSQPCKFVYSINANCLKNK